MVRESASGASKPLSVPQPRMTLVRRALRERRALRQVQASQVVLSRRWVSAAVASPSCTSSCDRLHAEVSQTLLASTKQQQQWASAYSSIACTATTAALPHPGAGATGAVAAAASTSVVDYFASLLSSRGYSASPMSSEDAGYLTAPTRKQVEDYQQQPFMSDLARRGDIEGLQRALEAGRGMDASNKFGESVVHIACRRGNMDVLQFLVANGGSLTACDDLGRFPLHEVCWAAQPRFDIVRVFLEEERRTKSRRRAAAAATASASASAGSDTNGGGSAPTGGSSDAHGAGDLNMLLVTDKRGCSPLRYVKEGSWPQWRRFLDEVVDEYWPSLSPA